jgi:hypothetical protein
MSPIHILIPALLMHFEAAADSRMNPIFMASPLVS